LTIHNLFVGLPPEAPKLPEIGILDPGIPQMFSAFRQGMRDHAYVEGQNISYAYRSGEGRAESVRQLAIELIRLSPDVIVTASPLPVRAVREATSTIPIVFVLGDAVSTGAVSNLSRPGGNMTGLSFLNQELSSKRLQLLLEALPKTRKVAVLWDSSTPRRWLEATEEAGRVLDVELQVLEIAGPDGFVSAFEAAIASHAEALDILASAFFNANKERLVELAAKYRLPAIYEHGDFVHSGGLLAYGPSIPDVFRRAATYVDKILKGANPGDLPVEQPTKFELVVNLKTASSLGLIIPPALLDRADEVIE
jgi:putative tryptophan/tyrosine transport system substrate-binding protein